MIESPEDMNSGEDDEAIEIGQGRQDLNSRKME